MKIITAIFALIILTTTPAFAQVRLSEFMPNPDGKDPGNEWIELYNTGPNPINIENHILDTGKKKQTLPYTIINGKSHLIINHLKIALRNTDGQLSLISPSNQTIDSITYDKAPSGQSYSHISIKKGEKTKATWEWSSPTKNSKNKVLYELSGKVITPPLVSDDYYFEIQNQNETQKIIFKENYDLLSSLLLEGTSVSILAEKSGLNFTLIDYKIESPPQTPQNTSIKQTNTPKNHSRFLLAPIAILGLLFFRFYNRSKSISTL